MRCNCLIRAVRNIIYQIAIINRRLTVKKLKDYNRTYEFFLEQEPKNDFKTIKVHITDTLSNTTNYLLVVVSEKYKIREKRINITFSELLRFSTENILNH